MIKIVHAADIHLDSPFSALSPEQAAERRAEQRSLLDEIAEYTNSCGAQLLLLAGDLFDSARFYAESEECLRRALGEVKARVFISPGNHDYYSARSPWSRLRLPDNVHIFTSPEPECVELPELGCRVWGAAFTSESAAPQLEGFRAPEGVNIMVLHGDTETPSSRYGYVSEDSIAASGLSYLALGHIHSFSGVKKAGATYYAYPGCPIGRGFDETGAKGILAGEVSETETRLEFIPLGARRYEIRELDVSGAGDGAELEKMLRGLLSGGEHDIWRVVLKGEYDGSPEVKALENALRDACCAIELRDRTSPRAQLWSAIEENTLKGVFLRKMKAACDASEGEEREKILLAVRYALAALENREEAQL